MKITKVLMVCLILAGCGAAEAEKPLPNVSASEEFVSFLQTHFDEVKECARLSLGKFEALQIIQMPPSWDCPEDIMHDQCVGLFHAPNTIRFGFGPILAFRHEVVHYLLFVNEGDPDGLHISPLFEECS